MKTKNIKYLSLTHLFKNNYIQEAMVSLGNSIELPALFKRLGWRVIFTLFSRKGKVAFRLRVLNSFGSYILHMKKKHGPEYVVNYLKCSQLAIQKAIAKDKISSLRELNSSYSFPRLSTSGLPRYIPLRDRRAIMNKSVSVIRFWLTLYSVYRIIRIPGKLKIETITGGLTVDASNIERVAFDLRTIVLRFKSKFNVSIARSDPSILLLESSSPTRTISWLGVLSDPFALARAGLGKPFLDYMYGMGYSKLLDYWVRIFRYPLIDDYISDKIKKEGPDRIGQLSLKEEAAGKIRVFALVDVWTQSIMKPLHDMLFDFLKRLPNDGTFDQTAAWKRAALKSIKSNCSFGYDLSAATDRLPIGLQVEILSNLIGSDMAKLWKTILVERDYYLKDKEVLPSKWHRVRYAVGQPMGALSSWGMLAVTHHMIVQLAFKRAYNEIISPWFEGYELLGDDIIIFDKEVAKEYLSLMAEIGVPINVSKSVVASTAVAEFAKVTTLDGLNVSALSWKMFISQNTLIGRVNILFNLLNKNYLPKEGLETFIYSVTAKSRWNQGNIGYSLLPLLSMFAKSGILSWEVALQSLFDPSHTDRSLLKNIMRGTNKSYIVNLLTNSLFGLDLRICKKYSELWEDEKYYIKGSLYKSINYIGTAAFNLTRDLSRTSIDLMIRNVNEVDETKLSLHEGINWVSQCHNIRVTMTALMWDVLFDSMKDQDPPLVDYMSLSVDDLLSKSEDIDRIREKKDLVNRAIAKLEDKTLSIKRKTNEIKLVKHLLKGYKLKAKMTAKR